MAQQRAHQPVAGPSSPPKAPRGQQQANRQPRAVPDPKDNPYSGYGYGNNVFEFGARRRRPAGAAAFPYGAPAYANGVPNGMPNGSPYGNQFYASSAPLPTDGPPMAFPQGNGPPPPTGPRIPKQNGPRLQVLPGSNNLYTVSASTSKPTAMQVAPRPPTSSIPMQPNSNYHSPPPPPPPPTPSSSTARIPPPPPPSTSSIPPSVPSAPRAMIKSSSNPLKGKGSASPSITINIANGQSPRSSQLATSSLKASTSSAHSLVNGSTATPTVEDLARAALAKAGPPVSSSSQPKASTSLANGRPPVRKVMSIAIKGNPSAKIAYPVRAVKGQLVAGKAKSVNVFEVAEEKKAQARREEAAAKASAEALEKQSESAAKGKSHAEPDDEASGPRYTPPPRSPRRIRTSKWEPLDSDKPSDPLSSTSTTPAPLPTSSQRSHTPPGRPLATTKRSFTPPPRHLPPPAPADDTQISPPPPPPTTFSQPAVSAPNPPSSPPPPPPSVQAKREDAFPISKDLGQSRLPTQAKSMHISISLPPPVRPKTDDFEVKNAFAEAKTATPTAPKPAESTPSSTPDVKQENIPAKQESVLPLEPARPKEQNWLTLYDPRCDDSPVKQSKGPIIRKAGKGVDLPVSDPRQSESSYSARLAFLKNNKKIPFRNKIMPVRYHFDEFSTGSPPLPPPAAILVTGLTRLTPVEKVRAHFASYGHIEEADLKVDDRTGGSLGICWIKYTDSISRMVYTPDGRQEKRGSSDGQDGNRCAKTAVERNHRAKIVPLTGNDGKLRVVLDGQGKLCQQEVKSVLDRKRGKVPPPVIKQKPEPPPSAEEVKPLLVPHASLPARPVLPQGSPEVSRSPETSKPREPERYSDRQSYRGRTPPRRSPERHSGSGPSPVTNKPAAREPYRLPPSASRSRRDYSRERGRYSPRRRHYSSDSDSESGSSNDESDDAYNRRVRDDDRVYGPGSRQARRLPPAPLVSAPQISKEFRLKIDALKKLADQKHPYIAVNRKDLLIFEARGQVVNAALVRGHLGRGNPLEVFDGGDRFYAIFKAPNGARRCYATCQNYKLLNLDLELYCEEAPTDEYIQEVEEEARKEAVQKAKDLAARGITQKAPISAVASATRLQEPQRPSAKDVILEARGIIIRDLRAAFVADLRKRLAAAHIATEWNKHDLRQKQRPAEDRSSPSKQSGSLNTKLLPVQSVKQEELAAEHRSLHDAARVPSDNQTDTDMGEVGRLPSFGRPAERARARAALADRGVRERSGSTLSSRPEQARATSPDLRNVSRGQGEAEGPPPDRSDETAGSGDRSALLKRSRTNKSKATKKSKSHKVIELHFTSSEEEDDEDEVKPSEKLGHDVSDARIVDTSLPKDDEPVKMEEDASVVAELTDLNEAILVLPRPETGDMAPLEAVITLPTPAPSESATSSTKRELSDATEEPAKRARLATPVLSEPPTPAMANIPTVLEPIAVAKTTKVPARKASAKSKGKGKRGVKQKKKASETPVPEVSPLSDLLTLGDQEDLFYLKVALARQRAGQSVLPEEPFEEDETADEDLEIVDPRHETGCARTEGYYRIPQPEKLRYLLARNQAKEDSNKEGNSSLSVSRLARVNARHLASGLDKHKKATATDTDLLQLNQLRTRKKQLRFARSPIHDWGLYALELIPPGEMVIEYVGEQIRQQVADQREKAYERQGIGSSYLFRVDDDVVIDATMKGNLGRLINHCCTPNCTAKILSVGNSKKIVIYAKQVINKGDEITYDYHFPIEDEKIVCLCGSSGCRGFLN